MFDSLLKSKFYSGSKSEIKVTMKRIEIIKRKRNAMQKFLKNDVADLLKNRLHSNAYDRVEQLVVDQNLSWCYEFIEQSCLIIISQLSAMNKQRESCPEECKEAISTVMFAAARFASLPELRELRSLFSERYGSHLEPFVNQEFIKNLKANIPTKEIKLQMLQEIAMEYDIEWDSKVLEQKLHNPPSFVQDWSLQRNKEPHKYHNQDSSERKFQETENKTTEVAMGHTVKNGLPYNSRADIKIKKEEEKRIGNGLPDKSRVEIEAKKEEKPIGNGLPYKSRAEIEVQKEEKHDHGRRSPYWSSNTSSCSETTTSPDDSASEDIPEERKVYASKSTGQTNKSAFSNTNISGEKDDGFQSDIPIGRKLNGLRSMGPPYIKPGLSKKTVESNFKDCKPVPRSMRVRRGLKLVSGDEVEKKMDEKLSHNFTKPPQSPRATRTGSLLCEPVSAAVVVDERKGITRASTYQLDSGLGNRGHVHPKLPDYDDFVARLAALRASS